MDTVKNDKLEAKAEGEAKPPTYAQQVGSRIGVVADKIGKAKLADFLGIGQTTLYRYINGASLPTLDVATAIAALGERSINWLAQGETVEDQMRAVGSLAFINTHLHQDFIGPDDDLVTIPVFGSDMAAGAGAEIERDMVVDQRAFKKSWITQKLGASADNLVLAYVRGDSMQPTLHDRDLVMLDRRDGANNAPSRDDVYAIRIREELLIKRIQRIDYHLVRVISDNKAYDPFDLEIDDADIQFIGRAVWWAHTNMR